MTLGVDRPFGIIGSTGSDTFTALKSDTHGIYADPSDNRHGAILVGGNLVDVPIGTAGHFIQLA